VGSAALAALCCVGRVCGIPVVRPVVWHVLPAEGGVCDASVLPAAVFHSLDLVGVGDVAVAGAASVQRGVVHRWQLRAAGLSDRAVGYRVRTGRLFPYFPAVFLVGHRDVQQLAPETAALLYAGDHTVLSHGTAAALWGIAPRPERVEVTIAGRNGRPRPGLRIHRVKQLDLRDVRVHHGLPVTSPARTLIDYAAGASSRELDEAIAEARVQHLITDRDLDQAMGRCPGRKGITNLKSLLESQNGTKLTRSAAERLMRDLLHQAELPQPEVNAPLLGYEIDFLWRSEKLALQVDGVQFHGHRRAFESDRRKDQVLTAAGYRVIRVTWRQLKREPLAVIARIAQALAAHAPQA
jgi:very-short-patch-repair endonuclease